MIEWDTLIRVMNRKKQFTPLEREEVCIIIHCYGEEIEHLNLEDCELAKILFNFEYKKALCNMYEQTQYAVS